MTAKEYFRNHWQQANRERFGDYGDYDSDEYAIAFAEEYAALSKKNLLKSIIEDIGGKYPEYHYEIVEGYLDDLS